MTNDVLADELRKLALENGPIVIDHYGEGMAWRPLDWGTWTPLAALSPVAGATDVREAEDTCDGEHCCCCGPGEPCCDCGEVMPSKACVGERCWCGAPASKKVGEEILFDDPEPSRHNLTSYICAAHYAQLMGPLGAKQVGVLASLTRPVEDQAVERLIEQCAQVAHCAFDDRPKMGHDYRWHDGYEAGCYAAAQAIRALSLAGQGDNDAGVAGELLVEDIDRHIRSGDYEALVACLVGNLTGIKAALRPVEDQAVERVEPFAWADGVEWHKPAHRAVMASVKLGGWMSAALDDSKVCEEMKADICEWFSAGAPMETLGQALAALRSQSGDGDVERVADWWKPDPEDPFWMIESNSQPGHWMKNEHSHLTTTNPAKALRYPSEIAASRAISGMGHNIWLRFKATEHLWCALRARSHPHAD